MRLLIQRVKTAKVLVDKKVVGSINKGLLIFLAALDTDTREDLLYLTRKVANLRIFPDDQDKMNRSLKDVKGGVLVVPQFTLYANCSAGNRPSFVKAGQPDTAKKFYDDFVFELKKELPRIEGGVFGVKMEVHLVNDGPVTFIVDSKKTAKTSASSQLAKI